jgi:hypothetical protein
VPELAQNGFAAHSVVPRSDGSFLAVGGVGVVAPAGRGRGRSIVDFAAAALTADLTPVAAFGGPASRVRLKLSIPPQTAAAATARGVAVTLDVSEAGLARVEVKASGHVIARGVSAIFGPGRSTVTVGLTASGRAMLTSQHGLGITATATARDLVAQGASASAMGTLS